MLVTNKWEVVGIFLSVELFEKLSKDWTIDDEPKTAAKYPAPAPNPVSKVIIAPKPEDWKPRKTLTLQEMEFIDGDDGYPIPNPDYIPPEERGE